jgi:hypothetical protein
MFAPGAAAPCYSFCKQKQAANQKHKHLKFHLKKNHILFGQLSIRQMFFKVKCPIHTHDIQLPSISLFIRRSQYPLSKLASILLRHRMYAPFCMHISFIATKRDRSSLCYNPSPSYNIHGRRWWIGRHTALNLGPSHKQGIQPAPLIRSSNPPFIAILEVCS